LTEWSSGSTGCGPHPHRAPFRALINHFGGAHAALEAVPALARPAAAPHPKSVRAKTPSAKSKRSRKLGATLVASRRGRLSAPAANDRRPAAAHRHTRPAPLCLPLPQVAIVGSRNASAGGVKLTQRIAHGLCEVGFAIVSGLARGIDAAAHRASLSTGTVAVLAGGH